MKGGVPPSHEEMMKLFLLLCTCVFRNRINVIEKNNLILSLERIKHWHVTRKGLSPQHTGELGTQDQAAKTGMFTGYHTG